MESFANIKKTKNNIHDHNFSISKSGDTADVAILFLNDINLKFEEM